MILCMRQTLSHDPAHGTEQLQQSVVFVIAVVVDCHYHHHQFIQELQIQYTSAAIVHRLLVVTVPLQHICKALESAQVVIMTLLLTLATVTGVAHRSATMHTNRLYILLAGHSGTGDQLDGGALPEALLYTIKHNIIWNLQHFNKIVKMPSCTAKILMVKWKCILFTASCRFSSCAICTKLQLVKLAS